MHVGPQSGFDAGKSYSILQADSLSGQFATATSNYAYLDAQLQYKANEVLLQLQRKSSDSGSSSFADRSILMGDGQIFEELISPSIANS